MAAWGAMPAWRARSRAARSTRLSSPAPSSAASAPLTASVKEAADRALRRSPISAKPTTDILGSAAVGPSWRRHAANQLGLDRLHVVLFGSELQGSAPLIAGL